MYMVMVDEEKCTGCGECAGSCPAKLLALNGKKAYVCGDCTECLGCLTCVTVCPSGAVTVQEY
ncbi:MAG: 4Fe-4S binding protein [Firmicutes bacterium]|nr:4Fe-4S binding protein [Bacillota bacterium]MCL5040375.1 4Fe-4S binding protein [Bacillota bacterium]